VVEVEMADDVAEMEAKIGALSHKERTELIRSLLAELDGPEDAGVEQAWLEEAERRHREYLTERPKGSLASKYSRIYARV
jgi:hypothetical protein